MRELLTVLLELLFPASADHQRLKTATKQEWSTRYQPNTYKNIVFLSHYKDSLVQTAIKENKFHHNPHAAQLLGSLLMRWSEPQLQHTAFVPIPLGSKRLRERGHNQVISVLEAAQLQPHTHANLLKRTRETTPQVRLDRQTREHNIKNAFTYTGQMTLPASCLQVILIDDVVTTGATLRAAKEALVPHLPPHIRLRCLALAH